MASDYTPEAMHMQGRSLPPPDPKLTTTRPDPWALPLGRSWCLAALLALALAALPFIAGDAVAQSGPTLVKETLVGTTSTTVPGTAYANRRTVAVQNLGAAPIWCSIGVAPPIVRKSWEVPSKGSIVIDVPASIPVRCISESAQLTTAATVTMEL